MELKELISSCDKAFVLNNKVKELEAKKKEVNAELDILKEKIIKHFEENTEQDTTFKTKKCMVYTVQGESVKVPKENINKTKLFDYIEKKYGKSALLGYQTINSATLNSFYKKEAELAMEADPIKGLNFKIDGLGEPIGYTRLNIKKL